MGTRLRPCALALLLTFACAASALDARRLQETDGIGLAPAPAPAPEEAQEDVPAIGWYQIFAPAPAPAPEPEEAEEGLPATGWFQAHGWLTWTGFGVFMPLGVITSRHKQNVMSAWFYAHIVLMCLSIVAIVSGAAIAFNKFDAIPGTPADDPAALHIRIGTAVFVMACLNFLMGVLRPHKGGKLRVVWFFFHFTIGMTAIALGWYTIFTGMNMFEENFVFGSDSGISDLSILKDLFAVQIAVLVFVYMLLGRWDHMVAGKDPEENAVIPVKGSPDALHHDKKQVATGDANNV